MANDGEQRGGEAERRQMARKHVLAVNGDPQFLDFIRELLQEERYNVTTTNYVAQTHEIVRVLQPDLVIVDLVYGQQAGWDLLEDLAQAASTAGIPVLVTSTNPRLLAEAAADPARYGTTRELVKPFDIDILVAVVGELIGEA